MTRDHFEKSVASGPRSETLKIVLCLWWWWCCWWWWMMVSSQEPSENMQICFEMGFESNPSILMYAHDSVFIDSHYWWVGGWLVLGWLAGWLLYGVRWVSCMGEYSRRGRMGCPAIKVG
ncbi:hypothetical protein BD324DRAFT_526388 [Kockovaella imperatae]|uniref:Uncharacterized protein n=1 Tax=Kockovaella imperatae TaxID=4999 RepID=A0A1Y1UDM2_9TREE|nr:hypothetical protein BD324DRAFT_526388 [Kockovaella imperatae]ORX36140.1 hypothetical protein BD324DRAFT_526388 [Kockovaella imperatae]